MVRTNMKKETLNNVEDDLKEKQSLNNNSIRWIIFLITAFSIGCLVLSISFKPMLILNENQILYIFSSAAQVVSGLFGLTLTGYIFFESKLNEKVREDKTLYDQVEELKKQHLIIIKIAGVLCILSISISILNIGTYRVILFYDFINQYLLNQAMVFFLSEVILIVYFSWNVLNPNKITQISDKGKSRIEKQLKNESIKNKNNAQNGFKEIIEQDYFTEFLKYYNQLEDLVLTYAKEIIADNYNIIGINNNGSNNKYQKGYKPMILQSLKILISREIINKSLYNEIDEIRQYRNYTVHGTDFKIDPNILERLINIYEKLNKVYLVREDKEQFEKNLENLYDLTR